MSITRDTRPAGRGRSTIETSTRGPSAADQTSAAGAGTTNGTTGAGTTNRTTGTGTSEARDEAPRLLRIQEVSAEVGLTPRSIRYYEEQGLLTPARSEGDYRLYDTSDVERLRFIKGLRDDAGFSLAEIRQLVEDEAARRIARERMRSGDARERREAVLDTIPRVERQIATLREKAGRIQAMTAEAESRLAHLRDHLAKLDGLEPAAEAVTQEVPR